jgi:hypothetical protein
MNDSNWETRKPCLTKHFRRHFVNDFKDTLRHVYPSTLLETNF